MKKFYLLSILTIFVSISFAVNPKYPIKTKHQFLFCSNSVVNEQNKGTFVLVFKITGMNSEKEAIAIDEFLKARPFVISSSTDFKTGLCKVETDKSENKAKIIEAICYTGKKFGNKITAELMDNSVEKEQK